MLSLDWIGDPNAWMALATLTILEIVLGIDNIIFISIITGRLPEEKRGKARYWGLGLAMVMRILLLLAIGWVMRLTTTLAEIGPFGDDAALPLRWLGSILPEGHLAITGKSLILLVGGLFLLGKSTHEIHNKLEGDEEHADGSTATVSMAGVLAQIMVLDLVFSLDSVITAVGMAKQVTVMIIAVVIAVGFMMLFAKSVGEFVEKHPTVKILALSFLILVGMSLVAEGMEFHISKGYIYFAMSFSVAVEMVNIKIRAGRKKKASPPVKLRQAFSDDTPVDG